LKIHIKKGFSYEGETYEKGEQYDVSQAVGETAVEKGYAQEIEGIQEEVEEKPELELTESKEPEPEGGDVWDQLDKEAKTKTEKPPNWNPEAGDRLHGNVVSTGQGPNSRFAEVEVAKNSVKARQKVGEEEYEEQTVQPGDNVLLWESTTLEDFFDQMKAGMKIAVHYEGKQKTSSGQKAKMFDTAMKEA